MKPDITVLMSVWNSEQFVSEAIESTLSQTYRNFQFLIIDDGSTDGTREKVSSFKDKRIIFLHFDQNLGLTKRLNLGLSKISTLYVARMDADDICFPNRLRNQKLFLEKTPDVVMCGCNFEKITENGRKKHTSNFPTEYTSIKKTIIRANVFSHSCLMFRTEILKKENGYNEKFSLSQDYELCLRLTGKYKTANLSEVLMKDRYAQAALSQTKRFQQARFALMAQLLALLKYNYPLTDALLLLPSIIYLIKSFLKL